VKTEYEPFDVAADYLVSEERIAGYLSAAAEDEDPNVLLLALCDAAKARGMMEVAKAAGLNRESLYKALKPGAHPRFETVQAVLRALGVKLSVSARASQAREVPNDVADEARHLAKEVVENEIRKAGKEPSDIETSKITQAVDALVEADKSYIEQAKETVRPAPQRLSIDAFRLKPSAKADEKEIVAAVAAATRRASKKAALEKASAEAAKASTRAQPATPAKKRA
jgi:probable addiction module antidote protein